MLNDHIPTFGSSGHVSVFATKDEMIKVYVPIDDNIVTLSERWYQLKELYFLEKLQVIIELITRLNDENYPVEINVVDGRINRIPKKFIEHMTRRFEEELRGRYHFNLTKINLIDKTPESIVRRLGKQSVPIIVYSKIKHYTAQLIIDYTLNFEIKNEPILDSNHRSLTVVKSDWNEISAIQDEILERGLSLLFSYVVNYVKGKVNNKTKDLTEEVTNRTVIVPNWIHQTLLEQTTAVPEIIITPYKVRDVCNIESPNFWKCYRKIRTLIVSDELLSDLFSKHNNEYETLTDLMDAIRFEISLVLEETFPGNYKDLDEVYLAIFHQKD